MTENDGQELGETRRCADCGLSYAFTVREQQFFSERGWQPPKRCIPCRRAEKARREGQ